MNEEKIKRFMSDPAMNKAVYDVLMATFLKANATSDVYNLASERIAINKLQEGWKELERYKAKQEVEKPVSSQVGM